MAQSKFIGCDLSKEDRQTDRQVGRLAGGQGAGCSMKYVTQEVNDKLWASAFLVHNSAVGHVFVLEEYKFV